MPITDFIAHSPAAQAASAIVALAVTLAILLPAVRALWDAMSPLDAGKGRSA